MSEITSLPDAAQLEGQTQWFLIGQIDESESNRQYPMRTFPFTIGRRGESSLPLPVGCISKDHAIIHETPTGLVLKELGSTNGTFVNGAKVEGEIAIFENDLIHFASYDSGRCLRFSVGDDPI